jgi:hypothetical protein
MAELLEDGDIVDRLERSQGSRQGNEIVLEGNSTTPPPHSRL